MSREEKRVILASSLGTVFEWYDFYLYGSLAAIIGAQFFSQYPEATRNVFALLAFAAGFLVRPFGALVFGRLGDLVGRKYTFLITILIMGRRPSWSAACRATTRSGRGAGGADHAAHGPGPRARRRVRRRGDLRRGACAPGKRGFFTSWIQTTATLGLLLSLIIIMFTQIYVNANYRGGHDGRGCQAHAVRRLGLAHSVPGLDVLLGISVWIRLQMQESPAFKKMKEEGSCRRRR